MVHKFKPPKSHRNITTIKVPAGLVGLDELRQEIDDMTDVLNGHEEPDIDLGELTLLEVGTAYLARAYELQGIIHRSEIMGEVVKNSAFNLFRTRELQSFIDLAKAKVALGQRRVTWAQNEMQPDLGSVLGYDDEDE